MERLFCFGKKDFCDNDDACANCDFEDGSGGLPESKIKSVLLKVFGDGYGIDRLKELVEADQDGRLYVLGNREITLPDESHKGMHADPAGDPGELFGNPIAKINRESWEPCGLCEKQRRVFNEEFCGECGRPITEEAWAKLERRLATIPFKVDDDRNGLCVVLSCRVGTTVYVVGKRKIVEATITEAYLLDGGDIEYFVSFECDYNCDGCPFSAWSQTWDGEWYCGGEYGEASVKKSEFGKTAFLTCEEAEITLKGECESV